MKKAEIYLKPIPRDIIQLAKENSELHRGLNDIWLTLYEADKGRKHLSIKNSIPMVGEIIKMLGKKQS